MTSHPLRATASAASTLALIAAGIAVTSGAAQAAPNVDEDLCVNTPVWTGGFTSDQPVHGLTTTKGITPEAFTGTYVSTLKDGASRGKDILLFRMEGNRITKANGDTDAGIWAGMSGSPVYDADDNLIGSVSYGFSGAPSNLAGVTPAKDLLSIQHSPAPSVTAARSVPVPLKISKAAAASTNTTGDDWSDYRQIHPLTLPKVSVGTPGKTATKFADQSRFLGKLLAGATPKFTTASAATDIDPTDAIVPGGNIASAWSHGDATLASVGTITAVCGNKVFAYGHPDDFVGNKSTNTFNAAEAAAIQEDAVFGSFKLANIDMDPIGQITQDRLSGIMGVTGQFPTGTTITTNTTLSGATTSAETKVSFPGALSSAVASQLFNDAIDGLDAYANGGEALMTWTINYTPKGRATASYTRTQRVSYDRQFAEQVPFEVASDLELLQFGSDTKVTINSVTVNTQLKPDYNALRVAGLEVRSKGKWVKVKKGAKVTARRGKAFPVQVRLVPANANSEASPTVKRLDQKVSKYARGTGTLSVVGLNSYYDEFSDFTIAIDEEDEDYYYDDTPLTLPAVLAALKSQRRYDSLLSTHRYRKSTGSQVSTRTASAPAITGGSWSIRLGYKK